MTDKPPSEVCYADGVSAVEEGDVVSYRSMLFWWRWKPGRVSYVPGKSKFHREMEFDGLRWVGVSGDDGTYRGVLVEPETGVLRKTVRFVRRGSSDDDYLRPEQIPAEDW